MEPEPDPEVGEDFTVVVVFVPPPLPGGWSSASGSTSKDVDESLRTVRARHALRVVRIAVLARVPTDASRGSLESIPSALCPRSRLCESGTRGGGEENE